MVEVVITTHELIGNGASIARLGEDQYILSRLKSAGAPVEGVLTLSLSKGTLTRIDDPCKDAIAFRWRHDSE